MKVLVIGYGSIGKRHVRVLESLGHSVDVVSRQVLSRNRQFAAIEEIEDMDIYDYYVICSDTNLHYAQLRAIEARTQDKLILVEKAVYDRPMPAFISRNRIFVGYNMRFEKPLVELRKRLSSAHPIFAEAYVGQYLPTWHPWADYRQSYSAQKVKGGGVGLDLSHEIDYLQWLFGEIVELHGYRRKLSSLEIETDDTVTFVGATSNGVIVNCTMDYINKIPTRFLIVHTDEESYRIDFIANELRLATVKQARPEIMLFNDEDDDYSYREMHRAITAGSRHQACTLEEAIQVLSLCQSIPEE